MNQNNLSFQEIYVVADFSHTDVSLLICVYQQSQFFILFNERKIIDIENKKNKNIIKDYAHHLNFLIKKAEHELKIKIKKISYNLNSKNIKIIKHFYVHQFPKSVEITEKKLQLIYKGFKSQSSENAYQNFLAKIINFHLIDQNTKTEIPPYGEIVQALKIEGLLYQVHWETIFFYLKILKKAKITPHRPVLFPYAAYIGLHGASKIKKSIILIWNLKEIQAFYFVNKIFVKQFFFKKPIDHLIEKITKETKYVAEDVQNYLFNFLNLNTDENKNLFDSLKIHNKTLIKKHETILSLTIQYCNQFINQMIFNLTEKNKINLNDVVISVSGEILKIADFEYFLKNSYKTLNWKINYANFFGLKDYRDLFLIGNAYYQHLENKLIYNEKQ